MNIPRDLRPHLREKGIAAITNLSPSEREALLVDCWMSHDARWFMAVSKQCGLQIANRLNQESAHAVGKVEAQRIARALGLPPMTSLDDYLFAQEAIISILGPNLLDYRLVKTDERTFELQVQRCFAYDNTVKAGVSDQYDCGIFARTTGWLEALGIEYEMRPTLGKCLKAQGKECVYAFTLTRL